MNKEELYINNPNCIISEKIRFNFLKDIHSSSPQMSEDFITISEYIDIITKDCNKMNDRHKELITESIWSTYEKFKTKDDSLSFERFFNTLQGSLIKIEEKDLIDNKKSIMGQTKEKTITIKSSLEDLSSEFDNLYLIVFQHELNHALSLSDNSYGLTKGNKRTIFGKETNTALLKPSWNITEIETEYLAYKILEDNFPEINNEIKNFDIKLKTTKNNLTNANIRTSLLNYKEFSMYIEALNILFDNNLEKLYFTNNASIEQNLEDFYSKGISQQFRDFYKSLNKWSISATNINNKNITFSEKDLIHTENQFLNLCLSFQNEGNFDEIKLEKIQQALIRNSIKEENSKYFRGELLASKLDFIIKESRVPDVSEIEENIKNLKSKDSRNQINISIIDEAESSKKFYKITKKNSKNEDIYIEI